jgi:hypothetical protein
LALCRFKDGRILMRRPPGGSRRPAGPSSTNTSWKRSCRSSLSARLASRTWSPEG